MIEVKINSVSKWRAKEYTFSDPQMGIRTINLTVSHPFDWIDGTPIEVPDFAKAYVEYEGERYDIANSKPTAEKDTSGLAYRYTLSFKGSESDLQKRKIRNLAEAGVDNFISQGTSFSLYADLTQFVQLLNNNLKYYFGSKWNIVLVASSDPVMLSVNNMFIWDLLVKTYEYYGVRWFIRGSTIYIGGDPEIIDHVFDYGVEGGLVKITRTAQSEQTVNRLIGTGGSRNVPINYFTDRYSGFPPDPDPISGDVNIKNIMPKVFRDSVKAGTLPYIDYVEDSDLVSSDGVKEDALDPNEDIFPSIAGVEVPGLGRIDQIIAVEQVSIDDPDQSGYKQTFDIWVKDIQFDLSDDQYTSTVDGKIGFTSGQLSGYEFVILAEDGKRKVVVDTSKSHNGVSSRYRITLIKSSEELEASGRMLPSTILNAVPSDSFVIYDINMPQSYVELAEERVQVWLESKLDELKQEKPSYTIEPLDQFFEDDTPEIDGKTIREKLKSGNKLKINNSKITDGVQELHINQVTVQYGGILPKYTFTVTDKVQVQGSSVQRLQSSIDAIANRQYFTEVELSNIVGSLSRRFLSKIDPDTAKGLIKFLAGINIGEFIPGMFGGKGARIDALGNIEATSLVLRALLEVPELRYNRLTVIGDELILTENGLIHTAEEIGDRSYQLNMKLEEGEAISFVSGDLIKGIFHHSNGFATSYMIVSEVGQTFMKATLANDADVPTPYNIPPQNFMNIARVGNVSDTDRQRYMVFSSKLGGYQLYDGCTDFLNGRLVASFDTAQSFKHLFDNLPLREGLPYIYAAGLVVQDIIRVDYQGKAVREVYDRGPWEAERTYYNNDEQGTDDVWHYGCRWRCFSSSTTEEPRWDSAAWVMIEGNPYFTVDFMEAEAIFDPDNFNTTLTILAKLYNQDVTDDIRDTDIVWTRYSEDLNGVERVSSDNAWALRHAGAGKSISLTADDADFLGYVPRVLRFTATVTLRDGITGQANIEYR